MRIGIYEGRVVSQKGRDGVIDKRTLGEARAALKLRLKQDEDEPLNCRFGPPSIHGHPPGGKIPRHLEAKFWEIMLKEGVIVRHPFGGYMHPRFANNPNPITEEQAAANIREALKEIMEK